MIRNKSQFVFSALLRSSNKNFKIIKFYLVSLLSWETLEQMHTLIIKSRMPK